MVLSTANLTKSLRDKSKPLLELLPTAQSVYKGEVGLFFPGKEEWLVEWLVERLEDEASSDARLSPDTWNILYDLLNTPNLNLTAASATLRKHKFVGIIAKTLSDAVAKYSDDEKASISINDDTDDVEMQDAASTTSSSATEPGSPLLRTTYARVNRHKIKREWSRRGQQVEILLSAVFRVVKHLKVRFEGRSGRDETNTKRRRLDLTTPIFKVSPETAAALCESYFRLLSIVVQGLGWAESTVSWTGLCQMIWKSCSYGVSDTAKLASLVSEKLLQSLSMILSVPSLPHDIREVAAWFLGSYIFQPVTAPKDKRSELLGLLKPLTDACTDQKYSSESTALSLPVVLELAIEKADRDYSVKQRRHADGFVSVLLSWMLSITKGHLAVHTDILDIAIQNKVVVEEAALKNSIQLALRKSSEADWAVLQAVVKIDLDVLLSTEGDTVFEMISKLDSKNCNEGVWQFIQQMVAVSVEARDLESLFERWFKLLGQDPKHQSTVWRSDRFQSLMASNVEIGLTQSQIRNTFVKYTSPEAITVSLAILDSILRGITRIETIDLLGSDGLIVQLFNNLTSNPIKNDGFKDQWQFWRIVLRLLDMWPALDLSDSVEKIKATLIKRTKIILSKPHEIIDDIAKELSILLALALLLKEHTYVDLEELEGILKEMFPRLKSITLSTWDGSFDQIHDFSAVAMSFVHTITTRFIPLLGQLDAKLLSEFLSYFIRHASEVATDRSGANLRSAWTSFVQADSKVYEVVKLKDTLLMAILEDMRVEGDMERLLPTILELLNQCPLPALRKSQREAIVDELFSFMKRSNDSDEIRGALKALIRLARLSTNSSTLATSVEDPDGLCGLFIECKVDLEDRIDLAKSVIRHLAESRHHEKAETQLLGAIALADKLLDKHGDSEIGVRAWSYAVIQGAVSIISDEKDDAIKTTVYSLIDKLFTILTRIVSEPAKGLESDEVFQQISLDLSFLESLVPLLNSRGSGRVDVVPSDRVAEIRDSFDLTLLDGEKSTSSQSLVFYGRVISTIASDNGKQATDIAFLLGQKGLYEPFRSSYKAALSRLEAVSIYNLLDYVAGAVFPASSKIPSSFYLILQDILNLSIATKSSGTQSQTQVAFIFSQLTQAKPACGNFDSLCILLNATAILLKDKELSISQLNIEETLASIATTVSSHGPRFNYSAANTDPVFVPVCVIIGSILSGQRYRIKNRHGLVVATLETLMNLLFLPRVTGRKKSDSEIHPPWLANVKSWTVTKEAAVAYCRLLTMLCDPSTSSVRMNRKSDSLSSATVAARKAVELHIPGLLKRYISLSLTHNLTADVRTALTPGLYAMFDVMQESTLRSLNVSLDSPGRVVFKSLYEDWNKFGKWVD